MTLRHLPWLALLISFIAVAWAAFHCLASQRAESAARSALVNVADKVRLIHELESQRSPAILDGEPSSGLSGQLTDSLAAAGLPPATLVTFHADADQTADGQSRILRRSARLTLGNLTLAQFGRFLSTWGSRHPEWVPAALTLSPQPLDSKDTGREYRTVQAPLTIQLTIECRYLPKPRPTPTHTPTPTSATSAGLLP
jgi:hypothetical protein